MLFVNMSVIVVSFKFTICDSDMKMKRRAVFKFVKNGGITDWLPSSSVAQ